MMSYHSNYEATNYDTENEAQHTSDVAYSRNSIIAHKFTTPHYFTNLHCD